MKGVIILVFILAVISLVRTQSPMILLNNIQISFTNNGQQTHFVIRSPLGNGVNPANSWVGIGFNSRSAMDGSNVVVCIKTDGGLNTVRQYHNRQYTSSLLDPNNPFVGLRNTRVAYANQAIECEFTRDNQNGAANYFGLNGPSYVTVAYGTFLPTQQEITRHVARFATPFVVNFPVTQPLPTTTIITTTAPSTTIQTTARTTTVTAPTTRVTTAGNNQQTTTTYNSAASNKINYYFSILIISLILKFN